MDYGIPAAVLFIGYVLSVYIHGARHRKEISALSLVGLSAAFGYFTGIFVGYDIFYTTPFAMLLLGPGYYKEEKT